MPITQSCEESTHLCRQTRPGGTLRCCPCCGWSASRAAATARSHGTRPYPAPKAPIRTHVIVTNVHADWAWDFGLKGLPHSTDHHFFLSSQKFLRGKTLKNVHFHHSLHHHFTKESLREKWDDFSKKMEMSHYTCPDGEAPP